MNFKTITTSLLAIIVLAACAPKDEVHNLTPDEARRAKIHAEAFFNEEHPAGTDANGNLIKKKGSFQACRPQDSNNNGLVTCTGMVPNLQGGFTQVTRYCGYDSGSKAILGCSDKDQQ